MPEGKELVREGDYSYDVLAIEEGTARVDRHGEHIADLGPGDVVRRDGRARARAAQRDGRRDLADAPRDPHELGHPPAAEDRAQGGRRTCATWWRSAAIRPEGAGPRGGGRGREVVIKVRDNGPYKVTGPVTIVDADGNRFDVPEGPIALCRCGQSQTKPFCDASHRASGFDACERAGA